MSHALIRKFDMAFCSKWKIPPFCPSCGNIWNLNMKHAQIFAPLRILRHSPSHHCTKVALEIASSAHFAIFPVIPKLLPFHSTNPLTLRMLPRCRPLPQRYVPSAPVSLHGPPLDQGGVSPLCADSLRRTALPHTGRSRRRKAPMTNLGQITSPPEPLPGRSP